MTQLLAHAIRRAFPVQVTGWIGIVLLCCVTSLRAADLPAPLTLDVPIPLNRALPAWIGQPEALATSFATLNLPIIAPDPNASLLVTVYFQEKNGGFLRIGWSGTQGAEVLSNNFYENIGMANQRSLLVSPASLVGDGKLTFQSSDASLGIQRIKLEWLENKNGLVSPEVQDLLVTSSAGQTQPALSLSGRTPATPPGAWQDLIVTVPMTDAPVRIEQGVDFSIDLDQVPGTARIALQETGLPLGKHLVVWINEQRAGTVSATVPDLTDAGFLTDTNGASSYVGWRPVSFSVPVSLLKAGVNTAQFSTEDDVASATPTPGTDAPLAIKGFAMQLDYTHPPTSAVTLFPAAPTPTADTPTADAVTADTPTGPELPSPQLLTPSGPDLRPDAP